VETSHKKKIKNLFLFVRMLKESSESTMSVKERERKRERVKWMDGEEENESKGE
jgi:hypothetical protein